MKKKIYTTENNVLTDAPEIQIGDKLYAVDNSYETFEQLQKQLSENPNDFNSIYYLVFGEEKGQEIVDMKLSVTGTKNLITYVMAAILDISFEEAQDSFRKEEQRQG